MSTANTTKAAAKAAAPKAVKAAAPKAAAKAATPAQAAKQPKTAAAPAAKQPKAKRVTVVPEGNRWTFAAKAITLDGHTFPATYSVKPQSGDVYVFAAVDGFAIRLHIAAGHALYHGAFEAAMAAKAAKAAPKAKAEPAPAAKQPSVKSPAADKAKAKASLAKGKDEREAAKATPAAKQPDAKPATPAKAAKQPKAAPKAKAAAAPAAKQPTGDITGKGWRIVFDDAEQRTRVCFTGKPSAKQKAAVEAAGFFWSQRLQSWNKKLTRKAERAARALAAELAALK